MTHIDEMVTMQSIVKINSEPVKTNSSYGNWVVFADAHFTNDLKQWDYPNKGFYFFTKARALGFINEVNDAVNNGRVIYKH